MNQPIPHTSLSQLLEASGVRNQYPDVVLFAGYIPGETDIQGAGLEQLVKFRLLHPKTPVLFFSFLSEEQLSKKDRFGVLSLAATAFVRLPVTKEIILQQAAILSDTPRHTPENNPAWKSFSEAACTALIQERITALMHGNRFAIGNQVLHPLRMNTVAWLSYPHQRADFLPILQKNMDDLHQFIAIPEIAGLLQWCMVCTDTTDAYLQQAHAFATSLYQLSQMTLDNIGNNFLSLVDHINFCFNQLLPKIDAAGPFNDTVCR